MTIPLKPFKTLPSIGYWMIFDLLAVEIFENAKAGAFPGASCRVLQSIAAVEIDPLARPWGYEAPRLPEPGIRCFLKIAGGRKQSFDLSGGSGVKKASKVRPPRSVSGAGQGGPCGLDLEKAFRRRS
jgi:hypothetical protein